MEPDSPELTVDIVPQFVTQAPKQEEEDDLYLFSQVFIRLRIENREYLLNLDFSMVNFFISWKLKNKPFRKSLINFRTKISTVIITMEHATSYFYVKLVIPVYSSLAKHIRDHEFETNQGWNAENSIQK